MSSTGRPTPSCRRRTSPTSIAGTTSSSPTATSHILEPLAVEARAAGVEVEILARHGHAAAALAALADERGAAQIFVGRHGHSRVHEVLFGSVPLALVHKAAVPVTVVP